MREHTMDPFSPRRVAVRWGDPGTQTRGNINSSIADLAKEKEKDSQEVYTWAFLGRTL